MLESPIAGTVVRVLPPFRDAFPELYTIVEVLTFPDGQTACTLSDNAGAFDPKFLVVEA